MTRRPRFSLRWLLGSVTAIALLLGWKTNCEYEREKAIAALSNAGATITVVDSMPDWLKRCLGNHAGEYVFAVGTRGCWRKTALGRTGEIFRMGRDESLDYGFDQPLSDITAFFLLCGAQGDHSFASLADADVAHLALLDSCRVLDLSHATLSDAGLAHLRRLMSIEYLALWDVAIDDTGLAQLHGLKSLRHLYLDEGHVTPQAIDALEAAIPGIEVQLYPRDTNQPTTALESVSIISKR